MQANAGMRTVTMREWTAERVRTRRRDRRWSQDDVAREMSHRGAAWSRSVVAGLEAGDRDLTPFEFAALCSVFRRSAEAFFALDDSEPDGYDFGQMVPLDQLLIDPDPTDDALLESWVVLESFRGAPVKHTGWRHRTGAVTQLPTVEPDLMTSRLAASLNVDHKRLTVLAHRLYGRDVQEEREGRLGDLDGISDRAAQARRGHVTRAMKRELETALGAESGPVDAH